MKLKFKHNVFWLKTSQKPEGWLWSRKRQLWYTMDAVVALGYKRYAVDQYTSEQFTSITEKIKISTAADNDVELPCLSGLSYRPFQKAGIHYALQTFKQDSNGVLIADQMGLGKTIEAIGLINYLQPKKILIICPASIKLNWQNELKIWLIQKYDIGIVYGNQDWPIADIIVINYDILKKFMLKIRKNNWDMLICDEAHYIKNNTAQRTRYVLGIKAQYKIALTGTPILNKPKDIFTMAKFCNPRVFPNFFKFAKRYCNAHQDKYGWNFEGASNLVELNNKLRSTIMIRRLKKEVLKELPNKIRQVVELPKYKLEKIIEKERKALSKFKNEITDFEKITAVDIAEITKIRHCTALAKAPFVADYLKGIFDKVVCFAWHQDVIDCIASFFKKENRVIITGKTPIKKRQQYVTKFQEDPNCYLYLANMLAGGVGVTLTSSSLVIFAELDWVPSNMLQAEDRCHRIGQEDSVHIQYIVLEGSIDTYIAQHLIKKQDIIANALGDNLNFLEDIFKNY